MTYPDSEVLIELFNRTHWVITTQTKGLTHADSLIQPPHSGNCLNWVVGHIVASRDSVLTALEAEPVWDDAELATYRRESSPITDPAQAQPFEKLLADLEESQARIIAALESVSPEHFEQPSASDPKRTVGQRVSFLHWHETYHSGQLEYLRHLAGKTDKVI